MRRLNVRRLLVLLMLTLTFHFGLCTLPEISLVLRLLWVSLQIVVVVVLENVVAAVVIAVVLETVVVVVLKIVVMGRIVGVVMVVGMVAAASR